MSTWHIELTRNGDGTITITAPEDAPEWVNDVASDLTYRFRDTPTARSVAVTIDGEDTGPLVTAPEEIPDAAAGATTGPVVSSGPGTPPPDATGSSGPDLSAPDGLT
jgi:hypothetical protein